MSLADELLADLEGGGDDAGAGDDWGMNGEAEVTTVTPMEADPIDDHQIGNE